MEVATLPVSSDATAPLCLRRARHRWLFNVDPAVQLAQSNATPQVGPWKLLRLVVQRLAVDFVLLGLVFHRGPGHWLFCTSTSADWSHGNIAFGVQLGSFCHSIAEFVWAHSAPHTSLAFELCRGGRGYQVTPIPNLTAVPRPCSSVVPIEPRRRLWARLVLTCFWMLRLSLRQLAMSQRLPVAAVHDEQIVDVPVSKLQEGTVEATRSRPQC